VELTEQEISEIKGLMAIPKLISIITHRNPDGDALGSSLAMKRYFEKYNHTAKVILPSDYPLNFHFMDAIDDCLVFDHDQNAVAELIGKSDIVVCLDFNSLDRIDKIGPFVQDAKAVKLLIDHHLDPEPFADYILSQISASSTCELVHRFISMMGDSDKIDKVMGEAIFTGLITDTGSFRYSTNPYTYQAAGDLKARGVDDYALQDRIFNSLSEKQLRLLGHALANRMEIIPEYKTGIIALTKQDYLDFDIQRGDTEGIVNYLLMIKGIEVAAFIREQPTIVKLSLRSKGDISVQQIARNHFNGGGHKNASGGAAYAKLDDIVQRFKNVLPKYVKTVKV
jgi:phosphoesterase RecJ-like protein